MKGHKKENFSKFKYVDASAEKCIAIKSIRAGCHTTQKAPGDTMDR